MELNDPSIISASPAGDTVPTQQGDLSQFVKFLRNKNEASQSGNGTPSEAHIEIEEIPSITEYKPDIKNGSKIYVYSINELLDITKKIPQEYIEARAELLPKKKFWRLYQKFSDSGSHKSNYRNNNKSRSYSNEYNPSGHDRKGGNNGKGKNSKNGYAANGNLGNGSGRKQTNKAMAVTNEELELDANFETSGNAIADFEAWKAQMKDLDRQKKMGGSGFDTSKQNRTSTLPQMSSKPANTQSSIMSDFLKLSRKDADSSSKNGGMSQTNTLSTTSSKDAIRDSPDNTISAESGSSQQQSSSVTEKPADLSRSGSSRFTSFFSNTSPDNQTRAVPVETNDSQKENENEAKLGRQQPQQTAKGSRLMNFFNTPDKETAKSVSAVPAQGHPEQNVVLLQPSQPMENPMQAPMRMAMPGQQMPIQPGGNAFFQNLLNKNKGADGNDGEQGNNQRHDAPMNQMRMPPPGMGAPQMGGMMQGPPPGLQSFNNDANKDAKGKDMKNGQQQNQHMGPPIGMPPPHMMQGGFMMPPHPGMPGFPGGPPMQGFPPQVAGNSDHKGKNKSGQEDSNNNRRGLAPQQPFMHMMGPPPPGFIPMQGMPPNMQFPPNGMMMPPMPPPGKDGKAGKGNMQQGFFPQQMPPNMNYAMNQNRPQVQGGQMGNGGVNQPSK